MLEGNIGWMDVDSAWCPVDDSLMQAPQQDSVDFWTPLTTF